MPEMNITRVKRTASGRDESNPKDGLLTSMNNLHGGMWATPRTITGGETLERKQELGRTDSGGGDLQSQAEQLWQTPATDSFRSRGGGSETRDGVRPAGESVPDASRAGLSGPKQSATKRTGGDEQGGATAKLYRAPLTVPGPGDIARWRDLLEQCPWLAPARSRFDWLTDGCRQVGLLSVGLPSGSAHEPVIIRDRRRGREFGRAIGQAIASERAQAKKPMGLSPAHDDLAGPAQVDQDGFPQEVESAFRRIAHGVAQMLDERNSSLRAGGNGVVAVAGAAAFIRLFRRIG